MNRIDLSVVVIGKNESLGLERLARSIDELKKYLSLELIYVDSASTDNSVAIARSFFDKVILLAADKNLSASAGRFVGTLHSHGKWILFLDGDMEVENDIAGQIFGFITQEVGDYVGFVGSYLHHYPDGSTSIWQPKQTSKGAEHFGGAVVLRRDVVNECNWNPRIFSNEEIDLYSRMQDKGFFVTTVEGIFIHHYTEKINLATKLKGNFFPKRSYLGKKYFGFGQLIASRIIDKNVFSLIKSMPEQFGFIFISIFFILMLFLGQWKIGLAVEILSFIFIAIRRSIKAPIAYLSFIPQAIFGYFKYDADWKPEIKEIYEKI